jgi:hypothetical protein
MKKLLLSIFIFGEYYTLTTLLAGTLSLLIIGTISAASTNVVDLTTIGSEGTVNGAIYRQPSPVPTTMISTFLIIRLETSGIEEGYNTDGTTEFQTLPGTFTHSLLLDKVPVMYIGGLNYRVFHLDINENNVGEERLLSLDELKIYLEAIPDISGYPTNFTNLVYDLDGHEDSFIKLDYVLNEGSGIPDMIVYIPNSLFTGPNQYVYLYSKFGVNYASDDGFEEWHIVTSFSGSGSGTEQDPYIITNVYQLQEMNNDLDAWYELGNDIDASETINWNSGAGFFPVGTDLYGFAGRFEGKTYKVTDLYINRLDSNYIGLFGVAEAESEIKNLQLENVVINGGWLTGCLAGWHGGDIVACHATGTVSGGWSVGGLVGVNEGSITNSNCRTSATGDYCVGGLLGYNGNTATLQNSYSTGSVNGRDYIGGLVGLNDQGSISKSYSTASVNGEYVVGGLVGGLFSSGVIIDSYSTEGHVTGEYDVGGLVGWNEGYITNSYSTGNVSGNGSIGGFVGNDANGTYHSCFWDLETSGQTTSGGGTGKTTTEMKQKATFTNWDFENVWDIIEGATYPYLRNIYSPLHFNLTFPLQNRNAYNARISAVFDHSMLNSYCPDDKMVTFTGEETTQKTDYNSINIKDCNEDGIEEPLYSFRKPDGGAFLVGYVNYVGVSSEKNNLVLQYDAHPGYDYPDDLGTPVFAAADGDLSEVNETYGWVKITHDGVGSGYETHYLHLNWNIDPGRVDRGQLIGKVGHKMADSNHLHFEVRYQEIPVDPYGWEGSGTDPYKTLTGADNTRLWEKLHTGDPWIYYLLCSPADMVVTDPDGLCISKNLNQIHRAAYDEIDIDGDGDMEDRASIIDKKVGEYFIDVIPDPNALPTDTYSLETVIEGQTMVLAQDVQIQDIPAEPYIFESKLNRCDFDADGVVDALDLDTFALHWLAQDCNYPDWCEGTDIDYNGSIDFTDFTLFSENWLWEKNPADIDINGEVNFDDYAVLAAHWACNDCNEPAWCFGTDLNRNGQVDILDLSVFAENWLKGVIP